MSEGRVRIRFTDVTQRFRLVRERPDTLREVFTRVFRRRASYEQFEALRHVSFAIHDGEAVGLVGRNGSGKSTALKNIAGIYRPSAGIVEVRGRVAPLIELGAGFHHELTGRENILLNGLLLGLSKREVRQMEERIIAFSELDGFIDAPVKQYSSGMYMRLGFAIASEADPDILLIDEILAVGDGAFQEKCLERIESFRRRGRTMVFVSHDLNAVRALCSRVLWLDHGRVVLDGPAGEVIAAYNDSLHGVSLPLAG